MSTNFEFWLFHETGPPDHRLIGMFMKHVWILVSVFENQTIKARLKFAYIPSLQADT